ncbi:MAG TPA: TetR/AcrR family transcriptional regulator [Actinomycetes bacterium]|nr:TetR/AcrR family transcriptional regulator [Actinomycetes bacterium]
MGGPRPRERILVAATRLFADEGIHATSVDRVIAEAGVAPMTVYRHFSGKDELVTATLERWSREWLTWLRAETGEGDTDPGARLERLWDALEKWFADEAFRGSYAANVATELRAKPSHPAQTVIAIHRAALRELLQDIATTAGVASPPEAALRLHMLIDGATAAAVVDRQPGAAASARAIATTVLSERQPVRA